MGRSPALRAVDSPGSRGTYSSEPRESGLACLPRAFNAPAFLLSIPILPGAYCPTFRVCDAFVIANDLQLQISIVLGERASVKGEKIYNAGLAIYAAGCSRPAMAS